MPRLFFRCCICGKDGETYELPDDPPAKPVVGWVVFLSAFWPRGVDMGPLVLRICGGCYLGALVPALPVKAEARRPPA